MRRAVILLSAVIPFSMVARTIADHTRTQTDLLVNIHDMTPREHRVEVFVLASPQAVRLDVVGAEPRQEHNRYGKGDDGWSVEDDERTTWPATAWILDARTREVTLTRQGTAAITAAAPHWERVQREVARHVGRDRLDGLYHVLRDIEALHPDPSGRGT